MRVFYGGKLHTANGTGVGLGNFDGLHAGHMRLVRAVAEESRRRGITPTVYTFTAHPENIMRRELFMPILTTPEKKADILSKADIEVLYFDEFDENLCRQTAEEFVKNVLVGRLGIRLAIVGEDYRFGYGRSGDVQVLQELGGRYGFDVKVIPPVTIGDKVVSSTYIRQLLLEGHVEEAAVYLGRKFSITGKVVRGAGMGKTLGYPTANMIPEKGILVPASGVYATAVRINEELHESITNVGVRPTFTDNNFRIETHILDYNRDIYNCDMEVFFLARFRDEKKFESEEALMMQIKRDVEQVKEYFRINDISNIM